MGFALSDLQLTSPAFDALGRIPMEHTGEGEDVSPALAWTALPDGTRSLAVVCHDPDAPLIKPGTYGFVHWVLYDIPADVTGLERGATGHTAGVNDMGNERYNGPMPPPGHGLHHYYFWLLAIGASRKLEAGLSMWELFDRIEGDVIGMNRLVGTYSRG
jgi:Raf kinase inhibitor-like YbhB/YbcL family protein